MRRPAGDAAGEVLQADGGAAPDRQGGRKGNLKRSLFNQVSIIGTGLIGGSLGLALRKGRIAHRVIGFARHEKTVRAAIRRGAIHDGDIALCPEWLGKSDLVVLAVPPEEVVIAALQIAGLTKHSFLMTDVASVKGHIVQALEKALHPRIRFVGSHPMAGSEKSGIEAADAGLFRGAACVVTRTARTNPAALRKVSRMWKNIGSRVFVMDPKRHDALVAQVSHAPHLAAVALTLFPETPALSLAGGGFSDATRIALSDPAMWDQICRMNGKEIRGALSRLITELGRLKGTIGRGSGTRTRLRQARSRRRQVQK